MKMYLASFGLGENREKLKLLLPENRRVGYIFNALDFTAVDLERRARRVKADMEALEEIGFQVEEIDLREYFGKEDELRAKIKEFGSIWASGGNVFILRQAMKLSGFDSILKELNRKDDFLYGAYSAGVCVLSPSLEGYQIVDDATETPYQEAQQVLWDGLGIIDYIFLPHFESDHPESEAVGRAVQYCEEKGIPYKTLRDGDAIIVE